MDNFPDITQFQRPADEVAGDLAGRRPGIGEFLGANVGEGFWNTSTGQFNALSAETRGQVADDTPLSRAEWDGEGFARARVSWDEGMTRGRAQAMARTFDENEARRRIIQNRDAGVMDEIVGFGAQILGSIPAPENFLPVAGPTARLLEGVGRIGRGLTAAGAVRASPGLVAGGSVLARAGEAATGLERAGLSSSILRGAVEGAGGNALAAPLVYAGQARYGEDVTWGRFLGDIAMGAVVGSAFGGAAGVMGRYADRRAAAGLVDMAARDIEAGRAVDGAPLAMARVAEDAAVRSAPEGAAAFVRPDAAPGSRLDLPVGPDGVPLSREEFEAHMVQNGTLAPQSEPGMSSRTIVTVEGERVLDIQRGAREAKTGEPVQLRAYHGTREAFDQFAEPNRERSNSGAETADQAVFFSTNPEYASTYAEGSAPGGNVRPSLVTMRNPLVVEKAEHQVTDLIGQDAEVAALLARAKAAGHDGVVLRGIEGGDIVASFTPENIRSVFERADIVGENYSWYRGALDAQKRAEAMVSLRPDPETTPAKEGASDDADAAYLDRQVAALDAEGRLTPEDRALLQQGDEAAANAEGEARALDEAAACMLRNIA